MKSKLFLQVFRRPSLEEDIRDVHRAFLAYWRGKEGLFGLPEGFTDADPEIRPGELVAVHFVKYPDKRLRVAFNYKFRSDKFLLDKAFYDDSLIVELKLDRSSYNEMIRDLLPRLALSFGAYRAQIVPIDYAMEYADSAWNEWAGRSTTNPGYHRLKEDKSIDVNGRNNIFTLHPAAFWDEELCFRALGLGAKEVARRLSGMAAHVELIANGVHTVLVDNFDLSFEEYALMNEKFGELLGIKRG